MDAPMYQYPLALSKAIHSNSNQDKILLLKTTGHVQRKTLYMSLTAKKNRYAEYIGKNKLPPRKKVTIYRQQIRHTDTKKLTFI